MSKPSIFSREYERKMKRRKRNTIAILVLVIVVISAVALKFTYAPIDFSKVRQNIQAWIDSDTSTIPQETAENTEQTSAEEVDSEPEVVEEVKQPEEQYMDISLVSGNSAKAVYIEENGQKVFKELQGADTGVTYDISPAKNQMLICDTNAQITLYNVDGSSKIISKDKYVSKSGGVFTKEATLASQPNYLWNKNPKFLSEDSIIFVTNRPYFGTAAVKQYVWISNYNNGTDMILWQIQGKQADIGDRSEKGVEVTVDGTNYYIGPDGVITQ
ncbi:MAG TPA: hypothetical protein DG753_14255 [Clostridium sp.]|nr:hypothetical protein [Clostridium sp.]